MKIEYIIVHTKDVPSAYYNENEHLEAIQNMVNEKCKEGYIPIGGIAARVGTSRGAYFLQAMYKETL